MAAELTVVNGLLSTNRKDSNPLCLQHFPCYLQFASIEFGKFKLDYGFQHLMSSPQFSESKNVMIKSLLGKERNSTFLLSGNRGYDSIRLNSVLLSY